MPASALAGIEALVDPRAGRAGRAERVAPLQPAGVAGAALDVDLHPEQVLARLGEDLRQPGRGLGAAGRLRVGPAGALEEHQRLEQVGVHAGRLRGAARPAAGSGSTRAAVATAPPGERSYSTGLVPAAARRARSSERSGVHANGSPTASPRSAPCGVGITGTFSRRRISSATGSLRTGDEHGDDQRDPEAEHPD